MNKSRKAQINKTTGGNIRALRRERNISLREMADLMEITPGYMGLMERGLRGIGSSRVVELCLLFEVSADFLLGLDSHREAIRNTPDYMSAYSHLASMEPEYISFVLGTIKLAHKLQQKHKTTARKTTKNDG